jgi:phi13 family phage major tail protein
MATIGLRDLFYAKITEPTGDAIIDTYGTPTRLARVITADIKINFSDATLYSDDGEEAVIKEFTGGDVTLEVSDLTPAVYAELLGHKTDTNGVVHANADDNAPYVALGMRALKPINGKFEYTWLYKVKFGEPDTSRKTKGQNVEFQTPKVVGTISRRQDNEWKVEYLGLPTDPIATAWNNAVYESDSFTAG